MLAHSNHFKALISGYSPKKEQAKIIIFSLALIFFGFCLLRPKWGKLPQTVTKEGRTIMIALDMSRSMLAQDFMPSRLEFVKLKLRVLLERLGPERVGLILFADKAFVHCPFTDDFNAVYAFLDQASHKVISSGGTSIAKALNCAISAFKNIGLGDSNKILFLITDGEDFSQDIKAATLNAKQAKLKVFTVGAATTAGAPVPILDRNGRQIGHEKDKNGKVAITKLNETFLQELSNELNGEFVKVSGSNTDIDFIVKKIESFEKEKMGSRKTNLYEEKHNIFGAIFMLLTLLEWFL